MSSGIDMRAAPFDFRIEALDPLFLPAYKGSTLRGGFGHAFKKVVCALKNRECRDCLLESKCVYAYVFETRPPPGTQIMRKYVAAPHPFLIEPPDDKRRDFRAGEVLSFRFLLIGKAIDYLPYFVYAFEELGKIGIGKGKGRYAVKEVLCIGKEGEAVTIYDAVTKTLSPADPMTIHIDCASTGAKERNIRHVTLAFLTPTRILYEGHLTLDIEFHMLIRALLRRLSLLSYFHGNGNPSTCDFRGFIERAKSVRVGERNLRWYDWERYSGRQDTRMKMGGFVGTITFEGEIAHFLPILEAGEIVHVGKGTTFGLGKYEIMKPYRKNPA